MQFRDGLGNERGEDYRNGIGHCYQYLVLNACSYLNGSHGNAGVSHELVEILHKACDKDVLSVVKLLDDLWGVCPHNVEFHIRLFGQYKRENIVDEVNDCILILQLLHVSNKANLLGINVVIDLRKILHSIGMKLQRL